MAEHKKNTKRKTELRKYREDRGTGTTGEREAIEQNNENVERWSTEDSQKENRKTKKRRED